MICCGGERESMSSRGFIGDKLGSGGHNIQNKKPVHSTLTSSSFLDLGL